MAIIIGYKVFEIPGVVSKNYVTDGEPQFKKSERRKPLQHLVLHETVGRTANGCKERLLRKGWGVQLILDRDGLLTCHGDLKYHMMSHGNQCNPTSVGIEVVNPYVPSLAWGMDADTIEAQWWTWCPDGDRRYVLPTFKQLQALRVLIPWLCDVLGIPFEFPTRDLGPKKPRIKGWNKFPKGWSAKPAPGIVAHRDYWKHADGRYLLEYLMAG